MANPLLTIWKKELIDTIRDRRTLFSTVVLPLLLMPAIFIGLSKFASWQQQQAQDKPVSIAISQVASSDQLATAFTALDAKLKFNQRTDPVASVKDKQDAAGLLIPADWTADLNARQPVKVTVVGSSIVQTSATAASRLTAALSLYNQQLVASRLVADGVPTGTLAGLVPTKQDVASATEQAGFGIGMILPLFIIIWSIVGGQTLAIDASAGERERKTLEALLLTPISRASVIMGKWLAVSTMALISIILSITSMAWALRYMSSIPTNGGISVGSNQLSGLNLDFHLTPQTFIILIGTSILMVALFSALNLSVSIFAKNFKEAQSYTGPLYLVVILPVVIVNTLPQIGTQLWLYAIPVINAVVFYKEVLLGQVVASHLIITSISLLITALIAIWAATRIYQREDVIFTD